MKRLSRHEVQPVKAACCLPRSTFLPCLYARVCAVAPHPSSRLAQSDSTAMMHRALPVPSQSSTRRPRPGRTGSYARHIDGTALD